MDLKKGKEKARELLNKLTGAFGALKALPASLGNLSARFSSVLKPGFLKSAKGKIDSFAVRLLQSFRSGRFMAEKRRPMFFILGGLVVLLFILIIIMLAANPRGSKKSSSMDMSAGPYIPAEDLFIPSEPDFLPGFLFEREPRSSWSVEDVRPYWKSPEDPGLWREEVKSAVDKLMEGVP